MSGGDVSQAVVVVLEQSVLHYEPPTPVRTPGAHAAAAITLSTSGDGACLVRPLVWPDVGPLDAVGLLEAELETRPRTEQAGGDGAVIVGPELGALLDVSHFRTPHLVAPADQPLTGVWSMLATAGTAGRTVVADDDPPRCATSAWSA